jgi:uncharacterized protein YjiS (DUF1127 family)
VTHVTYAASPSGYFGLELANQRETTLRTQVYNPVSGGFSRRASPIEAYWYRAIEIAQAARLQIDEWRRRARGRNELMTLSDRDLRDVRWTRAEVEAEARKPFWRA